MYKRQTQVSFDGSGDGNTALMGKHIDLFINGLTTSRPLVEAGSIVPLCVFDKERVEGYEDVYKRQSLVWSRMRGKNWRISRENSRKS